MRTPEQAWKEIERHLRPRAAESVPRRAALGRVLAEPLRASVDVPSYDASAMDGFAVRGDLEPGEQLEIAGILQAGDPPGAELPEGRAIQIMTGAPVPAGATRVVPIERVEAVPGQVAFPDGAHGPEHIRRRGEVIARGDVLLEPGAVITPGTLGLLATHGRNQVPIHGAPRVVSITTGDEVVAPEAEPEPGQLRDSHTDFLRGALAQLDLGLEPLGIAPDDHETLRALIERGLESDVLLLSGGVSMGEFDLVEGVLAELGCTKLFDAVAIQPGKPVVAAIHDRGWVFGLPGNPASAMVAFWLFVRPALRRMLGFDDAFWRGAIRGRLAGPQPAGRSRDLFLPARVSFRDGESRVRVVEPKGSHDVSAYAFGSALVRISAGAEARPAGEECEILPLVHWPDDPA